MELYVLTDGSRYIVKTTDNRYVADFDFKKACMWNKREAEMILKNNLNKAFKSIFRLKKVTVSQPETESHLPTQNTTSISADKPIATKKMVTKHYNTPIQQDSDFLSTARLVSNCFKEAEQKRQSLQERLEVIEKEILDIRHYVEFKALNACEGYNAYKMLRQRLIARRECKNELQIVNVLAAKVFTTEDIVNIENIINSFDTVTYNPRVLTDLFEEKEKTYEDE